MVKVEVKVKGIAPLLMNKFTQETGTSSRTKKIYVAEEEAERKTYRNDAGELCLPCTHFKAAMIKAGSDFIMKGRKTYKEYIKSGIFFVGELIKLKPQEYEIHEEPVVIGSARVMSWRPKLKEWSCEFVINIEDEMINQTALKDILEAAGKYKGVGDHRPEYGRFAVESFKVV